MLERSLRNQALATKASDSDTKATANTSTDSVWLVSSSTIEKEMPSIV
jgi:hypothetical protein